MEQHINEFKAAITAAVALLTTLWGWMGWLALLYCACMALDWLTGSAAAIKAGEWSSRVARDGIWHKLGSIVSVTTAGILDITIGIVIENIPGISLPFEYTVFFCPLVMTWYILTECGSMVENAAAMGATIPHWLAKAMAALKDKVDESVDFGEKDESGK